MPRSNIGCDWHGFSVLLILLSSTALTSPRAHAQFTTVINVPPDVAPDSVASYTQLNLSDGGHIGDGFDAGLQNVGNAHIEVNVRGGSMGELFVANNGSTINLSGGTWGDRLMVRRGSQLNITGGEFRLDGALMDGFGDPGNSQVFDLPAGGVLSGVLSDGTPFAVTDFDDDVVVEGTLTLHRTELPAIGPPVAVVPFDLAPPGIRQGQSLIVLDDGAIADDFNAGRGSTMVVSGGTVGNNLELVGAALSVSAGTVAHFADVFDGSSVSISGGSVGYGFEAYGGSVVNVTGGSVGESFRATDSSVNVTGGSVGRYFRATDSVVNVHGGSLDQDFVAESSTVSIQGGSLGSDFVARSSTVDVSDGTIGDDFRISDSILHIRGGTHGSATVTGFSLVTIAGGKLGSTRIYGGSTLDLYGGTVGSNVEARWRSQVNLHGGGVGDEFHAFPGSSINIFGGDFALDGVPVTGFDDGRESIVVDMSDSSMLTGIMEDGRPFVFHSDDTLRGAIRAVPVSGLADATSGGDFFAPGTLTLHRTAIPDPGPPVIFLPNDPTPRGIRDGQTLLALPGSALPDNFSATGSTIVVAGGDVGVNFEAHQSTVVISDGTVDSGFDAFGGSTVTISGGVIASQFEALDSTVTLSDGSIGSFASIKKGSTLSILGGTIGRYLSVHDSTVNISDGAIGTNASVSGESRVNISGGVIGKKFQVGGGAEVNISGGVIDEIVVRDGSVVNIRGGSVGDESEIMNSSVLNLSGGSIGDGFRVGDGVANISGGSIGDGFRSTGEVNISGGSVGDEFRVQYRVASISGGSIGDGMLIGVNSTANIRGGTLGDGLRAEGEVSLFGLQFLLDNIDISSTLAIGEPLEITERDVTLRGLLSDGSPFHLDLHSEVSADPLADFFGTNATLSIALVEAATPRYLLAGDFNGDWVVDAADYSFWHDHLGQQVRLPGASAPRIMIEDDYLLWRNQFGQSRLPRRDRNEIVPEPAFPALLWCLGIATFWLRSQLPSTAF